MHKDVQVRRKSWMAGKISPGAKFDGRPADSVLGRIYPAISLGVE
jgi:hypothetical protein